MASPFTSPTPDSDPLQEPIPRKRRKITHNPQEQEEPSITTPLHHNIINNNNPWTSPSHQRIYSSNLIQALHQVLLSRGRSIPNTKPARQIRQAADRVLALSAKGRTRWSRAILTSRLSSKLSTTMRKKRNRRLLLLKNNNKKKINNRRRILPAVGKKVRDLGRLVPGCRKLSFPNLLEEATDYIAALQMQVRAMTAVTQLLSPATHGNALA